MKQLERIHRKLAATPQLSSVLTHLRAAACGVRLHVRVLGELSFRL